MGNVKMRVWDVKHGNAIYIKTPNNKNLVYDLGRGDYSENSDDRSPLETLYDHYNIRVIDYLMITHPHRDHIDDILNLDKFTVSSLHRPRFLDKASVMQNISERDRLKFEKYFEFDVKYNTDASDSTAISNPENYGGVGIKVFQTPSLNNNLNNRSLFSVLIYKGIKVVIPGDNEYESLDLLMKRDDFREAVENADVLIAPHHGRESAYHTDFVKLVNPRLTIISDGSLCDTSANSKYSAMSRGWNVYKNGQLINRKLLTTNSDGEVYIDFGESGGELYLNIKIK
jgi:beta-lactamase superfamily II metal-dependent hydrolase